MINRVIHIPESTHELFKAACRDRGLRMRDVTDLLIRQWLEPLKVKKPQTNPPPKTNTTDPYTAPPFWAGRNGD